MNDQQCVSLQDESLQVKLEIQDDDLMKSNCSEDVSFGANPDLMEELKQSARQQESLHVDGERLQGFILAASVGDGSLGARRHMVQQSQVLRKQALQPESVSEEDQEEEKTPVNQFRVNEVMDSQSSSLASMEEEVRSEQESIRSEQEINMAAIRYDQEEQRRRQMQLLGQDSMSVSDKSLQDPSEELKDGSLSQSERSVTSEIEEDPDAQYKTLAQLRLQDLEMYQFARQALVLERQDIERQLRTMTQSDATSSCIRQLQRELWLVIGQLEHDLDSSLLDSICKKFAKEDRIPVGYQMSDFI